MNDISGHDISDELLMAYADGELHGAAQAAVAAYLSASLEGAQRLAVFTSTGRSLSGMFEQPLLEPVPQRLIEAAMGARQPGGRVISIETARRARPPKYTWLQAVAACVALVAASVGATSLLNRGEAQTDGTFALVQSSAGPKIAGADLAAVLEATPSGVSAQRTIAGVDAVIEPVLTFAAINGDYCRQYVVSRSDAASAFAGVACRDAGGPWRVEVHTEVAAVRAKNNQVSVAGKGGPLDVETAVDRLISGNVLGGDEEAELFKRGWSVATP